MNPNDNFQQKTEKLVWLRLVIKVLKVFGNMAFYTRYKNKHNHILLNAHEHDVIALYSLLTMIS